MNKKILIIGKNSFIGSNLKKNLSKFFYIKNISFEQAMKKKITSYDVYSHVINTSIHKNYINKKYNFVYDLDRVFVQRFKKTKFIYVFFNTRKIYLPKANIKENSTKQTKCFYSKNKLYTEKFLKKKLKSKFLSLRVGNVIGRKMIKNKRNVHNLFFDNYLIFRKKNKKILVNDDFKDFLSINQLTEVIHNLIKKEIRGIFNVSISEKIYISELLQWIDKKFYKKIKFMNSTKDSFYLSNKKLAKHIEKKPKKSDLKKFCLNILK